MNQIANIFHCKTFQKLPKMGLFGLKIYHLATLLIWPTFVKKLFHVPLSYIYQNISLLRWALLPDHPDWSRLAKQRNTANRFIVWVILTVDQARLQPHPKNHFCPQLISREVQTRYRRGFYSSKFRPYVCSLSEKIADIFFLKSVNKIRQKKYSKRWINVD
jgi:hypothetical protein